MRVLGVEPLAQKVDATEDDASTQAIFGLFLVFVLLSGPLAIVIQLAGKHIWRKCCAPCCPAKAEPLAPTADDAGVGADVADNGSGSDGNELLEMGTEVRARLACTSPR